MKEFFGVNRGFVKHVEAVLFATQHVVQPTANQQLLTGTWPRIILTMRVVSYNDWFV